MASAQSETLSEDENGQKRKAMEAMLDRNTAILELLNEFVRGEQDPCPEEAAIAREAYRDFVSVGFSTSSQALVGPSKRVRTFVQATKSLGSLPRLTEPGSLVQASLPQLPVRDPRLQSIAEYGQTSAQVPALCSREQEGQQLPMDLSSRPSVGCLPMHVHVDGIGRQHTAMSPTSQQMVHDDMSRNGRVLGAQQLASRLPISLPELPTHNECRYVQDCSNIHLPELRPVVNSVSAPGAQLLSGLQPCPPSEILQGPSFFGPIKIPDCQPGSAAMHVRHIGSTRILADRLDSRGSADSMASRGSQGSLRDLGNPRGSRGSQGSRGQQHPLLPPPVVLGEPRDSQGSQGSQGARNSKLGRTGVLGDPRDSLDSQERALLLRRTTSSGPIQNPYTLKPSSNLGPGHQQVASTTPAKQSQALLGNRGSNIHSSAGRPILHQAAQACAVHPEAAGGGVKQKGTSEVLSGSSLLSELRCQRGTNLQPPEQMPVATGEARGRPSPSEPPCSLPAQLAHGVRSTAQELDALRHQIPHPSRRSVDSLSLPSQRRESKSASSNSLLEQLLRDSMGNLSAEQEAGLLAQLSEKAAAEEPSSPDSKMREETILAGLGVIAPEEIGLRQINAPHRESGALLAQLRKQGEAPEGLLRETPSPHGEGSNFLAKLRSMSSSEDAMRSSPARLATGPRREPSLLSRLRPQVAWEAARTGLGGRRASGGQDLSARVGSGSDLGIQGTCPPLEGSSSRATLLAGAAKPTSSPLSQFGSGSLAVQVARGSEEPPSHSPGSASPMFSRGGSPALESFGSGSVAAEIAKGSLETRKSSPGLQRFGSCRLGAQLARHGSLDDNMHRRSSIGLPLELPGLVKSEDRSPPGLNAVVPTTSTAGPSSWRVQSGGSAYPSQAGRGPPVLATDGAMGLPKNTSSGNPVPSGANPTPRVRRVPPPIPVSKFSLEGVPGWRPPPSPPHTGNSPPRTTSGEQDDSGGSRMWTVHSLNSWAHGDRASKLQSRSSLHSKSSIQSQPSFHSWAGPGGNAVGTIDAALGGKTEASPFTGRWGKTGSSLEFPNWPRRSPSPGRAARAARANQLRGAVRMPPPASPPKTHSSDGSPRNRLADFGMRTALEGSGPPSDQGSPSGNRPATFSRQLSPDPMQPRSPETGGSGSPSPSGARSSFSKHRSEELSTPAQHRKDGTPSTMEDFTNNLLRDDSPAATSASKPAEEASKL